jgi:hypothetical protein
LQRSGHGLTGILSRSLPGWALENKKKSHSGYPAFRSCLEPSTSPMQAYSVTAVLTCPDLFLGANEYHVAQAVSRRLPTAAARARAQVRSYVICGGLSGTEADFLRVLRFPLPILIPPTAPHSSSIIRGWYNRLHSGRRTKWTVSLHPKKLKEPKLQRYFRTMKDKRATEVNLHAFHTLQLDCDELQIHVPAALSPRRVNVSHSIKAVGICSWIRGRPDRLVSATELQSAN